MTKHKLTYLTTIAALLLASSGLCSSKPIKLTVAANKPTAKVQPTMWGIFFEDINFAADGGIYAELVKNRSFEFLNPLMGWHVLKDTEAGGKILIENRGEVAANNPRYARIALNNNPSGFAISNEGFRGMGVKAGEQYRFSIMTRNLGATDTKIVAELVGSDGSVLGSCSVNQLGSGWNTHKAVLSAKSTDGKARLNVRFYGAGVVDVDMVSLFPIHTWKERENGLRADLVQLLHDLKPGFVRFPGGCIVEGRDLANRYQWKNTVGKVEDRKLIINRWNTEFGHRLTPDYFQSYGLGFYEYFLLSEDIGAEPLPILNCGMACQYNTGEVVPIDQLDPFIQDMLDLIEFANGDITTKWGKLRAEMGHPKPFNLKMVGVGNEQWDVQYIDRYRVFANVLKAKYPDIKLISSAGPSPDGKQFNYLWGELKSLKADLVDEHYYQSPSWFYSNATRYDSYDRNGPKVFAGEYASHTKGGKSPESRNCWEAALSEAALMTGLERNADVVSMASYAPLLAHTEAWQWNPNLIWFDNLRSFGTPSYYIQKAFANNSGTDVVSILRDGKAAAGKDSLFASATINQNEKLLILKLVNASSSAIDASVEVGGVSLITASAQAEVVEASGLSDYNSFDEPVKVAPKQCNVSVSKGRIALPLPRQSFCLVKVRYKAK